MTRGPSTPCLDMRARVAQSTFAVTLRSTMAVASASSTTRSGRRAATSISVRPGEVTGMLRSLPRSRGLRSFVKCAQIPAGGRVRLREVQSSSTAGGRSTRDHKWAADPCDTKDPGPAHAAAANARRSNVSGLPPTQ